MLISFPFFFCTFFFFHIFTKNRIANFSSNNPLFFFFYCFSIFGNASHHRSDSNALLPYVKNCLNFVGLLSDMVRRTLDKFLRSVRTGTGLKTYKNKKPHPLRFCFKDRKQRVGPDKKD